MKNIIIIFILLLFTSCNKEETVNCDITVNVECEFCWLYVNTTTFDTMFTITNDINYVIEYIPNDTVSIVVATKVDAYYNIQQCNKTFNDYVEPFTNDTITLQ